MAQFTFKTLNQSQCGILKYKFIFFSTYQYWNIRLDDSDGTSFKADSGEVKSGSMISMIPVIQEGCV